MIVRPTIHELLNAGPGIVDAKHQKRERAREDGPTAPFTRKLLPLLVLLVGHKNASPLVKFNRHTAETISVRLRAEALKVDVAECGGDALNLIRDFDFDLVLVHLALSDIDGNSLVRKIRSVKHETPIIALSAMPLAHLQALEDCADDVVTHNVDPTELCARIHAIVRRSRGFAQALLQIGDLTVDVNQQKVVANGVNVHLTVKEYAILELLVLRRNMILTKGTILDQVYGGRDAPAINIIDVFIYRIRGKLLKAGLAKLISTIWGSGYCIKDIAAKAPTISSVRPQLTSAKPVLAQAP